MTDQVHMIIDCDAGVDDAQAIMLALAMPNVELVAITCVAGNVDVDKVCINALKVLEVCDRLNVPVYKGATSAILGNIKRAELYHGQDGMGDADGYAEPDLTMIKEEVAAVALVRMVNERPGQISIAAIGPLTNIAIAMKLDPHFTRKLKEIVIMGGELEGKAVAFLTSEFNFTCDPEAVQIVLSESQCPVDVLPFEVCRNYGFSIDFFEGLISHESKKAKFIKAITACSLEKDLRRAGHYIPCDLYAIATLVKKLCVTRRDHVHVQVELHGSLTRGKMITDWNKKVSHDHNINIITEIDMDSLKMLYSKIV